MSLTTATPAARHRRRATVTVSGFVGAVFVGLVLVSTSLVMTAATILSVRVIFGL